MVTNQLEHYHTDPLFKQLKVQKIQEIINLEMVKLVFLMKNYKLLGPIMDAFKKNWQQRGRNKKAWIYH